MVSCCVVKTWRQIRVKSHDALSRWHNNYVSARPRPTHCARSSVDSTRWSWRRRKSRFDGRLRWTRRDFDIIQWSRSSCSSAIKALVHPVNQHGFESHLDTQNMLLWRFREPHKEVKVKVCTLDIAPLHESVVKGTGPISSRTPSPQKRSGMARVLEGSHGFTCSLTRSSTIGMSYIYLKPITVRDLIE